MAYTYSDLQTEVKHFAIMNEGSTDFDTVVKNAINFALFRVGREKPWRVMRRESSFDTVTSYTEGSEAAAVTDESKDFTVTGATFLTDGVEPGRYIKFSGSSKYYKIATITGETTGTLNLIFDGTTATDATYEVLPQEQYILPVQSCHRMFMWHREDGRPYLMNYGTDKNFYESGVDDTTKGTPTHYHMWGADMVISQPKTPGVIAISSSATADTSIGITVFGTVSNYPDYEIITTNSSNGTTSVSGSKSFSKIDRISKGATSTGRITATADSTNTTVAVMPVGDTTSGILYRKVRLWPLPDSVFDMNVHYYKDPYRLVNDNDVHDLGQDFDQAIIYLAIAKLMYGDRIETGDKFMGMYKDEIKNLKKTNMDKIDWIPMLERPNVGGSGLVHPILSYSQVGAGYGRRV